VNPWATLDDARIPGLWPDAGTVPDATLDRLLDAAYLTCLQYAPRILEGGEIPVTYTEAVVVQAREHWATFRRDGGVIGFDNYAVKPRPLTDEARLLLRPPRGVPVIGVGGDP
jgi:hypothetical protein